MHLWLNEIYILDFKGEEDEALDILFHEIEDRFMSDMFQEVDQILLEIDLAKLSTTLLVGLAGITFCAKGDLKNRTLLIKRIELLLPTDRREQLISALR